MNDRRRDSEGRPKYRENYPFKCHSFSPRLRLPGTLLPFLFLPHFPPFFSLIYLPFSPSFPFLPRFPFILPHVPPFLPFLPPFRSFPPPFSLIFLPFLPHFPQISNPLQKSWQASYDLQNRNRDPVSNFDNSPFSSPSTPPSPFPL